MDSPMVFVAVATALAFTSLDGGLYEFLVVDPFLASSTGPDPAATRGHLPHTLLDSCTHDVRVVAAGYLSGKGTAKFPLDQPTSYTLIGTIVKFRVKENLLDEDRTRN